MAEGAPPPSNPADPQPDDDEPPRLTSGNYIVQFPREQIFHVPPPENARVVERSIKSPPKRTFCSPCLKWVLLSLLLVVLLVVAVTVAVIVMRPKPPILYIDRLSVKSTNSTPKYYIGLRFRNPNERVGIYYEKGGSATLSYKGLDIASGTPPAFYQRHHNMTNLRWVLTGLHVKLPLKIKKSMKGKGSKAGVSLSLSSKIPIKIGGKWTMGKNLEGGCNLKVNTFSKEIHIKSQECHSNISN